MTKTNLTFLIGYRPTVITVKHGCQVCLSIRLHLHIQTYSELHYMYTVHTFRVKANSHCTNKRWQMATDTFVRLCLISVHVGICWLCCLILLVEHVELCLLGYGICEKWCIVFSRLFTLICVCSMNWPLQLCCIIVHQSYI